MAKKITMTVAIDPQLKQRVDRLSKMIGMSRSKVIADLLADAVESNETSLKMAADPVVMNAFMRALGEPGVMRGLAAAVRADLSDDQMRLFEQALEKSGLGPRPAAVKKVKKKG